MNKKGWGALSILMMVIAIVFVLTFFRDTGEKPVSTVTAVPVPSTSSPTATSPPVTAIPAGTAVPTFTKPKPAETAVLATAEPSPTKTASPTRAPTVQPESTAVYVEVMPGDTVSGIYFERCGSEVDWPVMCEANGILQPYTCHQIYPGMKLTLVCKGS